MTERKVEHYVIWADWVRIIAILLVILIHTFSLPQNFSASSFLSLFLFAFAKTCIPLFVMLSGALLLSKQEPFSVFMKKRMRRILIPWITWSIIFSISIVISNPERVGQILVVLREVFSGYFTFLPMLFCLYLMIPTLRNLTTNSSQKHIWYVIALWFVATSLLPYMRNTLAFPLYVDNGLVTQTIKYSGYLLAGLMISRITIPKKIVLYLFLLQVTLTVITAWLMSTTGGLASIYASYFSPLIVISSMLLFTAIGNLQIKPRQSIQGAIQSLSKASFGVFLIHGGIIQIMSMLVVFPPDGTLQNNLMRWVTVTIFSFTIILILMKIPRVRNLIT